MKLFAFMFIATLLLVGINSSESEEKWKDDIQKWLQQCSKELEIPEEKIKEYETMEEPPADELGMCLTACILEKAGLIVDGKLHEETANGIMKELEGVEGMEGFPEVAKKCYTEASAKTEKCEIAGELSKCIHEGMKDMDIAE